MWTGNGLIMNASKTQLMLGGKVRRADLEDFHVLVDGVTVFPDKKLELLGVNFDSNFSTFPHGASVAASARQRAAMIARGAYLQQLERGLVLGKRAGLSSLNELTVHAVAMETWRAFHSQDGPDGSRNALGQVLFHSNVATRSTRSEAAGVVSPHLPYAANTLVDNGIAMWNKFPALPEASPKRMASNSNRANSGVQIMSSPHNGLDNVAFDKSEKGEPLSGGFYQTTISENNMNTYVYDADQSFRRLTMEALPNEKHYRRLASIMCDPANSSTERPTIGELTSGHRTETKHASFMEVENGKEMDPAQKDPKGKVIKFGWIDGVLMRCLLNIWGVMLFLRLSWVVGQCGIVQGLLVISVCNLVTFLTTLSMSAVSTNGVIRGGGIYYMISRSLGAEFGGAIGIMFTLANSIAVATYIIGFVDSLLDMLTENVSGFDGIADTVGNRLNDMRWIGAVTLTCVLILAVVGMEWVTRVEKVLLLLLIISQVDFVIGTFMPAESEAKYGFVGYNTETFTKNLLTTNYHDYKNPENPPGFFQVLAVFFPAVTGIVAGANLSGDLRDPAEAIPKGTLTAVVLTYFSYLLYATLIGSCYLSEASGIEAEYLAYLGNGTSESGLFFDNCTMRECQFGSSNDQQTLSKI
eukprot:maker-scaffold407_size180809-snap-gene-0.31 protein:Tk12630 transcript:maker-scaffold407_size180809-snap-gene-0.31-mRNA-1 annotation:"sodium-potassium-chloride cotransporter "